MTYQEFENRWLGKRVDYDGVFGYQCVDLIKQYLRSRFGLRPGSWGNAIDYWRYTNPAILKKFDKVSSTNAKRGDIVILKGLSGNPYGHIGIATGRNTTTTVEILEQNGSTGGGSGTGKDAIRKRAVLKSRIAGLLRPKSTTKLYYTVQAGDTLTSIAKKFNTSIAKLVFWNAIKNPNIISVGRRLRVR